MRRIHKEEPPQDVYPDGQQLCRMREAESDLRKHLPEAADPVAFARARFDALEKRKLRAQLLREQKHICVYCQERIKEKEGADPARIEHWHPVNDQPKLALCWDNLYLSCRHKESCDIAKGRTPFRTEEPGSDLPWPTVTRYHDMLGISKNGEMYVRTDSALPLARRRSLEHAIGRPEQAEEESDTGILRLNHRSLRAARRAAIDAERDLLKRKFKEKTASKEERETRALAMIEEDISPPYISARVAYLRSELGRHKP